MNDHETDKILMTFKNKSVTWTTAQLKAISPGYKTALKEGTIQIFNGKLVIYKKNLCKSLIHCINCCSATN